MRECGKRHLGVCWTERFRQWSRNGPPPEYRPAEWYLITPTGRVPKPC